MLTADDIAIVCGRVTLTHIFLKLIGVKTVHRIHAHVHALHYVK